MEILEFYKAIGVENVTVMGRLRKEELVRKYLLKIPDDKTYQSLTDALEKKDYETAFRDAHTLKGVAANLDLEPLLLSSSALTETLRNKNYDEETIDELYQKVKTAYFMILDKLKEL